MAKISVMQRNEKRKRLAQKYNTKRADLKKKAIDMNLSDEERDEARTKLQKLPRNSVPCRQVVRCVLTGRARGVYRKFGLSRIKFRELALKGYLPGVTKASW